MTLTELAVKWKVDKHYRHHYMDVYDRLLSGRKVRKLLEVGIGYSDLMAPLVPEYIHGCSLHMWAEAFPEAEIYGCDIREDTLFQTERIKTTYCDQRSPISLLNLIAFTGAPLTVVCDDGSHQLHDQIMTARTLFPYLEMDGIYIVEDVQSPDRLIRELSFLGRAMLYTTGDGPDDCIVTVRKTA